MYTIGEYYLKWNEAQYAEIIDIIHEVDEWGDELRHIEVIVYDKETDKKGFRETMTEYDFRDIFPEEYVVTEYSKHKEKLSL